MRNFLSITLILGVMAAGPVDVSALSVERPVLGGRFESVVHVDENSPGFPWNYAGRSPANGSRLMLDLSSDHKSLGFLYLKGSADWSEFVDEDVRFTFDQGDYLWEKQDDRWLVNGRIFANERRFLTGSASPRTLDDDYFADFENIYGARLESELPGSIRILLIDSQLDDGIDRRNIFYGRAGWFGRYANLAYGLRSYDDSTRSVLSEVEMGARYRRVSLIATLQHTDEEWSTPSLNWDKLGDGVSHTIPDNGNVFAEARIRRLASLMHGHTDLIHHYRATARDFQNGFALTRPGVVANSTGLYWYHDELAADVRCTYDTVVGGLSSSAEQRVLAAETRAGLQDGSELLLRVVTARNLEPNRPEERDSYVHGSWRRSSRTMTTAVHAMFGDVSRGQSGRRFGIETRLNWSASVAFFARAITSDEIVSHDTLYWRVELRPNDYVFATFGFGDPFAGDDPYMLEDVDLGRGGSFARSYTVTVRGDF